MEANGLGSALDKFISHPIAPRMLLKEELQRENKVISYERVFKMMENVYVYHRNRSSRSRVIKL